MRTRICVASAAVLLGFLTACSPSVEEPTPEPTAATSTTASQEPSTPEPTTAEPTEPPATVDPQQAIIDSAIAAKVEYVRLQNEVLNAGGAEWQAKLQDWWGNPDIQARFTRLYSAVVQDGIRSEGSSTIESVTVLDYVEDPTGAGHEQVTLEVCEDVSQVTQYQGDVAVERTTADRYYSVTKMQHLGDRWTIIESETQVDRTC